MLGQGTFFVNKEKESVFLRIKKGKHFPAQSFIFFIDQNWVSFDLFSLCLPNMGKLGKWFPEKWIPENKQGIHLKIRKVMDYFFLLSLEISRSDSSQELNLCIYRFDEARDLLFPGSIKHRAQICVVLTNCQTHQSKIFYLYIVYQRYFLLLILLEQYCIFNPPLSIKKFIVYI